MDAETLNFYIQKIEEFVLDDDKIVTYKWLSKTLGVHVNLSKQLLFTFSTESHEAQKVGITKTYFISGMLSDNSGWKVVVVKEDKLKKVKSLFQFITSNHIYSVQKAKNVAEISSFYEVDRFQKDESDKVIPAITCTSAIPRPDFEISSLRINTVVATPENNKQLSTTQKTSTPVNKAEFGDDKKSNEEKKEEVPVIKKPVKPSTNGNVKKPGGIAALFAAQESKIKTTENATQPKQVKGKNSKVSEFFGNLKNNVKKTENDSTIPSCETSLPVAEGEIKKENKETSTLSKNKFNSEHQDAHTNKKQKISNTSFDKKNRLSYKDKGDKDKSIKQVKLNKKCKINEDSDAGKKRKRIITLESDSSGDDIFEDEEVPDSPPSPELEQCPEEMECDDVIPCTPLPKLKPGRKHRRKLIDKTFMDEEGYLITQKEYVNESCSDTDTEKENELKVDEKVKSNEVVEIEITKEVTKSKNEEVTKLKNEDVTKLKNEDVTKLKNEDVTKLKNEDVTKLKNEDVTKLKNEDVRKLKNEDVRKLKNEVVTKSKNKESTKLKIKEVKMKGSQKSKQSTLLNFFK